jgi:hypothetical protein
MRGHFFAYRDVGTSRSAGRRVSDVAYRDGRFGRPVLSRHSYILYIVGTVALARPVLRDIWTSCPSSRSAGTMHREVQVPRQAGSRERRRGSDAPAMAPVFPGLQGKKIQVRSMTTSRYNYLYYPGLLESARGQ